MYSTDINFPLKMLLLFCLMNNPDFAGGAYGCFNLNEVGLPFKAQMYRWSAVHYQVNRHSQRVPGYLTGTLCQPMKSLLKKTKPIRLCLSNHVGQARNLLSLHLMTSTRFWRHSWSIIQNMTLSYDLFFKWYQSGPKINLYNSSALKSHLDSLPTSKAGSK